jgi:RNA polymerase sigma factor (TIGR02999 family)
MKTQTQADVTRLFINWTNGDKTALEALMSMVYGELYRLARRYLRRERSDHTLQSTALVHEAYLRLVDQKGVQWQNRAHFFAVAAQMIRRILCYRRMRQAPTIARNLPGRIQRWAVSPCAAGNHTGNI